VKDCARANVLALNTNNKNTIYNLGCGQGTTVNEIFTSLKEITGYPREPKYGPAKIGETRRIYLSAEKARRELDWTPIVNLEEGLKQTVEYCQTVEMVP
jgi:UDP-glucose 4-epimerase